MMTPRHEWMGALDCQGTKRGAGFGFSVMWREPTEIGMVGCETSRGNQTTPLTMSAFSFPQLTHILSRIFFTFTMNPIEMRSVLIFLTEEVTHTRMKDRPRKLNVTKMTWALRHPLSTSLTFEVPINCTHARVHQSSNLRPVRCLLHDFRMFDFGDGVGFL